MRKTVRSQQLFRRAQKRLVGGVNSPVRAFRAVGGDPLFIARGQGPFLWDADGNRYLDFVGSWGPLILGHARREVLAAVRRQMGKGLTYGAPTALEAELAEAVSGAIPSMEKVRFVSSGTEAAMSALRLARAFTARSKIVKFAGCYHGHSDGLLAKAGSGVATLGLPGSAGVPASFSGETIVLPYNNLFAVEEAFARRGKDIAAVIVEPVAANMGVVLPRKGYLEGLRRITRQAGALLIFDEVITGFRLGYGGAQELCGVRPDLTCLGKIVGGGMPCGAFGGRSDIMNALAPLGPVYQAGTLSGNPMAMAAGLATLKILRQSNPYALLNRRREKLTGFIDLYAQKLGLSLRVHALGSMFTLFFADRPIEDDASGSRADTAHYGRFFHALLDEKIYFPPSQFEAAFLSTAHTDALLDRAAESVARALRRTLF
jgi:glutamate-1-semialdehyde 2,1-aminomutase